MKKIHIYHITLTNGELLKDIKIKGSLERKLSGVGVNFISAEDADGKTVTLSKFHIIKAELVKIEE
ncbi:hypothetical protein [Virgibacillus alimentarius]|uniref:Phage protein n=1 Tax=Virgibacillus alimentarius TaxID=698769 RepID=A0ABS4S814_9BACI|nr:MULTISPECIES: hypothetical protein [Virgibacillus]MBP2257631.1 hypothetical protein [Virgibacillus alimentarius]HLR69693.1 hypothetical protein [Virgibacillus sp.]